MARVVVAQRGWCRRRGRARHLQAQAPSRGAGSRSRSSHEFNSSDGEEGCKTESEQGHSTRDRFQERTERRSDGRPKLNSERKTNATRSDLAPTRLDYGPHATGACLGRGVDCHGRSAGVQPRRRSPECAESQYIARQNSLTRRSRQGG